MPKYEGYDFCGWATRNDVLCADGRTIRQGAFKADDGKKVPLIWGHQHDSPETVLGHGYLENRPQGVYVYGYLNDSPLGKYSKVAIEHGDITSLSIWANQLKQSGGDVLHGSIKEVSLVLAGANQKACIEYPCIAHGDDIEENMAEAYIYMGEEFTLSHSAPEDDEDLKEPDETKEEVVSESKEEPENKEGDKDMDEKKSEGKSIGEIFDTMSEDQKMAVAAMIAHVKKKVEDEKDDGEKEEPVEEKEEEEEKEKEELKHSEGGSTMQYNAFDNTETAQGLYLSHSDEESIIATAKKYGSFKQAMEDFYEDKHLAHDGVAPVSGATSYANGGTPAGVDSLFPEWHDVRPGAPEIVTNDQAWVKAVLNKVHKSPFSRIRTSQTDLRNIETIRAKGYQKGTEKILAGNYTVAKSTTAPQTVYVKSALNRDDIVDITDFDYVDYQYKIDRMQLEKELAMAILIGDGRDAAAADKINTDNIRPIWNDSDVFTITKLISTSGTPNGSATAANFGEGYLYAQATEEAILDAMIDYRGSGAMDMFCSQAFFNKLQLAKDLNGRRIYNNKNELMAALDVNNVYNVPEFQGKTRTATVGGVQKTYKLLAILVNMNDYSLGATKGGEITHFTQFDIDFNQEKSLLETRVSGANTRVLSAIVIEEEVSNP